MIERGENWGTATTRSLEDVQVTGDNALSNSTPDRRLIVSGGDIAHSLGNPPSPLVGEKCIEVRIDALHVLLTRRDGSTESRMAASSVVLGSWRRGRLIYVTNGGFVGKRNVSPRAHPNDGVLSVMSIDPSMGLQQRLQAREKSRLGNHVPHPLISNSRARIIELDQLSRAERLRIDGRHIRSWVKVQIEILPDYWRLLI